MHTDPGAVTNSRANTGDLYKLLKAGLGAAIVITVVPGLLVGPFIPSSSLVVATLLGTFLVAIGSFVYNQIIEIDRDAKMERTSNRPLPSGRVSVSTAYLLGSTLLCVGLFVLAIGVNWLAAAIALFSFLFYVFVYTSLLKPRTPLNTLLGGLAGAVGPLIGEAAVAGRISADGIFMFLLLFLWQPPHFWCLAIRYKEDYRAAGFPMLPVARGVPHTHTEMLVYQTLLLLVMVAGYWLEIVGPIFAVPALLVGAIVWIGILRLKLGKSDRPMRVFAITILHMVVWHGAISIDFALRRLYV